MNVHALLGQQVAYWVNPKDAIAEGGQPQVATVSSVDMTDPKHLAVNLSFLDDSGNTHSAKDVPMYTDGDRPAVAYCQEIDAARKAGAKVEKEQVAKAYAATKAGSKPAQKSHARA